MYEFGYENKTSFTFCSNWITVSWKGYPLNVKKIEMDDGTKSHDHFEQLKQNLLRRRGYN